MKKLNTQILQKLCFCSSSISKIPTTISNNGFKEQLSIQNQIKLGIEPSISDLNDFLYFLFQSEKLNLSLHFFSQITTNSFKPNKKSNLIVAEALLKFCNGSRIAGNFALYMESFGIKAQNEILDLVIFRACTVEIDTEFSFNLLQEFVGNYAFVPSCYTLYTLIYSLGYKGDLDNALKVFDFMSERNAKYPYWNCVCSSLISKFSKIEKIEFGMRIYERIKKIDGFSPNLITYMDVIHELCNIGRIKEASDLVYEMENKGMRPDFQTYNPLINEMIIKLTNEGRIKEAYNLTEKNSQNGASIDLSAYSLVMDKLCKAGFIKKALDLCENMQNSGAKPNIVIYNSILHGLCKEGCLVEAFRLVKFLEGNENDLNLKPTICTYAPLISALCKEGLLDDAHELFDKMLERDILPNIFIINLIINGNCQLGLVENSLIFLSNMVDKYFIQPDDFTVSFILMGYYCKGDIDGGFKYYKEYKIKNIFPDFFGFMHLVNGFYSKGRMEEARGVIREMLNHTKIKAMVNKYGNEIYNESLVSLLLVACDKGRIEEVIKILKEVGSMYNSNLKDSKEIFVDMKFDDCDVKNRDVLKGKSLNDDFDEYYSIMKELCEKGEIKEINNLINAMILNSEVN